MQANADAGNGERPVQTILGRLTAPYAVDSESTGWGVSLTSY